MELQSADCCGQSRIDPRADDGLTQAKSLQSQCWQWFARQVHGSAESRHMGQKWIGANSVGDGRHRHRLRERCIWNLAYWTRDEGAIVEKVRPCVQRML